MWPPRAMPEPTAEPNVVQKLLADPTFRRAFATILGPVIAIANKKWGWELSDETVLGLLGVFATYVFSSNGKEALIAHADARSEEAKAKVATIDDALAAAKARNQVTP